MVRAMSVFGDIDRLSDPELVFFYLDELRRHQQVAALKARSLEILRLLPAST